MKDEFRGILISSILLYACRHSLNEMKSTKVQTLGAGHALVHTEHLVGSEDTRHYVELHVSKLKIF